MSVSFKIIVLDYARAEHDFTPVWDQDNTKLNNANGIKKTSDRLGFKMPQRVFDAGTYTLKWRMEVWAGWRDDTTGEWQSHDLWGGFVRSFRLQRRAGMMFISVDLDTYDLLFYTTAVPAYPDQEVVRSHKFHYPAHGGDGTINGYTESATAIDWLVGEIATFDALAHPWGGKSRDGILPKVLHPSRIDLNGVGAQFGVLFDLTSRPSNTSIPGHLEGLWLWEAVELVLSYAALVHRANFDHGVDGSYTPLRPIYYMKPVPYYGDATRVIPRFMAVDFNTLGSVTHTFSDNPADEHLHMWSNFQAEDDATGLFTEIFILGAGAYKDVDDPDYDPLDPIWRRVWAEVDEFAYDSGSPSTTGPPAFYQLDERWQSLTVDSSLSNFDEVNSLAHLMAEAVWDGKRRYTFDSYHPVEVGDIVKVIHRATQGILTTGVNYPVVDVDKSMSKHRYLYHVTLGWEHPTLQDVLTGSAKRLLELQALGIRSNRPGTGFNFNNPNAPKLRPINGVPHNRFTNGVRARTDDIPAFKLKSAINRGWNDENGMPIEENTANRYIAPIVSVIPERPMIDGVLVEGAFIPPPLFPQYNTDGTLKNWSDAEAYDHPQHHTFSFVANDFEPLVFNGPVIISTLELDTEYDAAGAQVWPKFNTATPPVATGTSSLGGGGMTIKIRRYDRATATIVDLTPIAVNQDNPLYINEGVEKYVLQVAGLPDGHKIGVNVSEANPHPHLFGVPGP